MLFYVKLIFLFCLMRTEKILKEEIQTAVSAMAVGKRVFQYFYKYLKKKK